MRLQGTLDLPCRTPHERLIQNNDKVLVDKVQSAIYNTIPLWKSQIVIALGLSRQQKVLQMQREVTDTTNELLRRNAEMLKQNTIETARETERGIVDIETVKKVNEDLISTIEETIKIQKDGRERRKLAEAELVVEVCGCRQDWSAASFIETTVAQLKEQLLEAECFIRLCTEIVEQYLYELFFLQVLSAFLFFFLFSHVARFHQL